MAALVSVDELEAWLGAGAVQDVARADAVLVAVSSLVRSYAGQLWDAEPVPDEIRAVVKDVAARVWDNPRHVRQQSTGPFSVSYSVTGLYLTDEERAVVGRYNAQARGLWTMGVTRNDAAADTVYVPVQGTATEFPWYGDDVVL